MAHKSAAPTNYDDAYVAGYYFGRGYNQHFHPEINEPGSKFPVHVRRAYERGVFEGFESRREEAVYESAQIIAAMAEAA